MNMDVHNFLHVLSGSIVTVDIYINSNCQTAKLPKHHTKRPYGSLNSGSYVNQYQTLKVTRLRGVCLIYRSTKGRRPGVQPHDMLPDR